MFTKLEELGFCETGGVIEDELFPVLAIAVHEIKSEVLSSLDEVSTLKLLSPGVGVDGVTGALESHDCVLLSFTVLSHP